jgi:hypothetical protein
MTKPNRRTGHHRSYAQINEKEKPWGRTSMAVGENLNGGGGPRGGGAGARCEPRRQVREWRGPRRRACGGGACGGHGGGVGASGCAVGK